MMFSKPVARLAVAFSVLSTAVLAAPPGDPLLDWSDWEKYRGQVKHPSLAVKPADVARAKENIRRHKWAQEYLRKQRENVDPLLGKLTPEYVARMIEATTPVATIFTPCPACREQGKPVHPHGEWAWSAEKPDEIACKKCATTFPNAKYPETISLKSTWDPRQTFSFYSGDPFVVFGYKQGRPSFTGNVRAQKVTYMAGLARRVAEVYALTGEVKYAAAVKPILLRFAEVYPKYLVHVGYGEIADMDPREAAFAINKLPKDELVYPPNKPNKELHTGYWSGGRATGVGMEGGMIRQFVEAYDLTVTAAGVYGEAEKLKIEKDLLLEGTVLAVADKVINNKSVSNRSAVGMVGMALGLPKLFRYAHEGFVDTVDNYFLKDGSGPETPSYTIMAVNGVDDFANAIRGYSDPAGHKDEKGQRFDGLDPYSNPRFAKIWQAMFDILQGDLTHPALADTHPFRRIPGTQVEEMAAFFPDNPQFTALLKETSEIDAATAVYYRDPDFDKKPAAKLTLPDVCYPEQRIGFMRTGDDGRESLLLLDASHWGIHHHEDSLNLYYWKNGKELLSDLGYLWDHPDKSKTHRTLAHNTVLIDEKPQATKERGGTMEVFEPGKGVKVMRASSKAYPQASVYRRTAVLIDHGGGNSYAVDLFEVGGGKTQDYVFHGPNKNAPKTSEEFGATGEKVYDFTDVKSAKPSQPWTLEFAVSEGQVFTATMLPAAGEQAFVATGWGQRDYHNTDRGATLPYVVRRASGEGKKVFASVFEGHAPGKAFVKSARREGYKVVIKTAAGTDEVTLSPLRVVTASGGRFEEGK